MTINTNFVSFYKQWNPHINIDKQLSGLSGNTLCKSRKIKFSAGVSNVLFSVLRSQGNILLIEEVLEISDMAFSILLSYMLFNSSQSSRTDFEKSFKYFRKLTESCWQILSTVWYVETFYTLYISTYMGNEKL